MTLKLFWARSLTMRTFFAEFRFALRLISKRPGLALATAVTLGLGIGLATTMFAVVNGSVWRGLPFKQPDRVVHLERTFARRAAADPGVPLRDFLEIRRQQTSFGDLAAFSLSSVNVSGATGRPERYGGAYVTANTFDLLGVTPAVGRAFRADEDRPGAPLVAIVSDAVWRDHFDRNPKLDGLTIRLDGTPVPVVGVMPPRFRFPSHEDVWLPLRPDPSVATAGGGAGLQVIGRLRDDPSLADAQAELSAIAARLAREYPATNEGVSAVARPYVVQFLGEAAITLFYTLFAAAVGVLLIACMNIANLLLATATLRTGEMAMRAALGASRARIVFQLLVEVLVLAAAGGVAGVLIARVGIRLFNDALTGTNPPPPFWLDIRFDTTAALFVVGLVLVVSLAAGLVPAVRASGARAAEVLKDESRGGTGWRVGRFSQALVMVEIALSSALLVGAALLVRSVANVSAIDFGFAMDRALTGGVALAPAAYPDQARQQRFWSQLVARIERQPGVRSVTLTSNLPGLGSGRMAVAVEGAAYASEREYPLVRPITIAPRFFETFDVALLAGRDFGSLDGPSGLPVAIVNRHFADRFLSGARPVGRRLRVVGPGRDTIVTIVGVAPNMRIGGVRNRDPEAIYLPLAQSAAPIMNLAVRTHGDPLALATPVRDAVATLDPDLAVSAMQTMDDVIAATTWFYGTFGRVFVIFGSAALVLVVVGLYGLMTFSVSQRTREIGVRLAMGARPADVVRMVFRQALVQVSVGLAAGMALAAWASRLLSALLVGVDPRDPAVYALIIAMLVLTALLAVAGPALRAARTSPTDALRHE